MPTMKNRESIGSSLVRDIKDTLSGNAYSGGQALTEEKKRRMLENKQREDEGKDSLESGKGQFTTRSKKAII